MSYPDENGSIVRVLALCRFCDVTPRLFEALVAHYGNLERITKADSGSLMAVSGMTAEAANKITAASKSLEKASRYYETLEARGVEVISRFDDSYPRMLFELNDPPPLLYVRGKAPVDSKKSVAVGGADNASGSGIELTVKICKRFAEAGVQIVSSLGRGIDSAAHVGSKAANGGSYAVLDSGFDNIHPSENSPLVVDIVQAGGLLTEYSPDKEFDKQHFRASNRLIAGLAHAVVVTEVYKNSYRTLDLLSCCSQIGKLAFVMIDPKNGALADQESLDKAVSCGAIPTVGLDKVDDIIRSLV